MKQSKSFVEKTVLSTPQPTATSTVDRKEMRRKSSSTRAVNLTDDSYGILSLNSMNLSGDIQGRRFNTSDESMGLEHQRRLASQSLQRAKVAALPSKYLKPNCSVSTAESSYNFTSDGTTNESDLLLPTPSNTSTPRSSSANAQTAVDSKKCKCSSDKETVFGSKKCKCISGKIPAFDSNSKSRPSLGQSMAKLSKMVSSTNVPFDNLMSELSAMDSGRPSTQNETTGSDFFVSADQAASKLLADELSWRKFNDIPNQSGFSKLTNVLQTSNVSVGEFFKQRSDRLSELTCVKSPVKNGRPTPLIDVSDYVEESQENVHKSLSISSIARVLETNTPRAALDYFTNQVKKYDDFDDQQSLPVSKNSSYTSNYSENEAMQRIVNKENLDTSNIHDKKTVSKTSRNSTTIPTGRSSSVISKNVSKTSAISPTAITGRASSVVSKNSTKISISPTTVTGRGASRNVSGTSEVSPTTVTSRSCSVVSSVRSASTLTNLPDGKLPIETTKCELIWGCVKPDKCVTQEFVLRNKSSKNIRIQLSIAGHSFKIRVDNRSDSDVYSVKMLLHAHESKSITIAFMPTVMGAAIDEVKFTSLDCHLVQTKKQCIRLYGYGGYGNIEVGSITKDTNKKYWLNIGNINNAKQLSKSITLKNTGTLTSFVHVTFLPRSSNANVTISSTFCILVPQHHKEIVVSYTVSAEDYKKIKNANVIDIGILKFTSGTEVNRGRLRRLCRKASEANMLVDSFAQLVSKKVENEVMPSDLIGFKENVGAINDVLNLLLSYEVILTLELDPEQTLMPQYPEDSVMFQSLLQDTTVLEQTIRKDTCKIEPDNIILTPPNKAKSVPDGLEFSPKTGCLRPFETSVLTVSCSKHLKEKINFKVLVYLENEIFEVTVKTLFIHRSSS